MQNKSDQIQVVFETYFVRAKSRDGADYILAMVKTSSENGETEHLLGSLSAHLTSDLQVIKSWQNWIASLAHAKAASLGVLIEEIESEGVVKES